LRFSAAGTDTAANASAIAQQAAIKRADVLNPVLLR